jgi:recombination protein RecA
MFLKDNPALMAEIEEKVKVVLGVKSGEVAPSADEAEE